MFKYITIHLRGPLCGCAEQDLAWAAAGGLVIRCKGCGTRLEVPAGQLGARFDLEIPYPGGRDGESRPRLRVLDGGKVLLLRTDGEVGL